MKIHHLNCGTLCPLAPRLLTGSREGMVCHCLLLETEQGLVLVDTGFGSEDVREPKRRLGSNVSLLGTRLSAGETAEARIQALGFKPEDVRHILLTHLDLDHAGGISDFPRAKVHLYRRELEVASAPRPSLLNRQRYRPVQWAHRPQWELYDECRGEAWFGFQAVRNLVGLPPEILLVPLTGHTFGHCAVAVSTNEGWLVHAGDAYFFHGEMEEHASCPAPLRIFQKVIAMDNARRVANRNRLRELALAEKGAVRIFCAHDHEEFHRHAGGTVVVARS